MIYQAVVRQKLRASFAAINQGDYVPVLAAFAPDAEHAFFGDHALGGARRGLPALTQWYARLQAILPDLHFDIGTLAVNGPPWNTSAFVEWRDRFTMRDGRRGANQGVHALTLKWGKVTALRIYCDTIVLRDALARLSAQGVVEAGLPPIGTLA